MRIFLLLTLVAALVYGCGAGPTQPDADQVAAAEAAAAEAEAGNYTAAAERYEQLADDSGGLLADRYRLNAAEAYNQAGDNTRVKLLLERIEFSAEDNPVLFVRERLLEAKLALASDDTALAQERLEGAYAGTDQPQLRAEYHWLQAEILERQGDAIAAMDARLAADHALVDQPQRQQYAETIWRELRQLDRDALVQLRDGAPSSAAGWIDLAQIERARLTNADNLRRTLDDWQLQYSGHPAVETVLPKLREFAGNLDQQPRQIALLLPFESNYDEAARIIRDGFIAGWYQDNADRPELRIYDADADNIIDVYKQAVTEGAELIVGPLRKESLAALVESGEITVPTLALNYYEGDPNAVQSINSNGRLPSLYQFSLAPEDEARQVAERAWFDGHGHALVMTPSNDWGDRIHQAFSERFKALGGEILERVAYSPRDQQFSDTVETLLNIDESVRRYQQLRDTLQRSLESNPRRRQDADFIMLAGYPPTGRQVGPQLQFNYAGDMPVYATSHIFDGAVDRNADADMNGFIFADMPWLIDADQQQSSVYKIIEQYWPNAMDSNPRLYAFGLDAYRILSQLSRMAMDSGLRLDGASGQLSVADSGHIHRQLKWARFVNGAPQSMEQSPGQPRPQPAEEKTSVDDSMVRH